MSRRTAEASKAVALAWTNEQQRVKEGNGTRDWTPEQQKDILERGKAYDLSKLWSAVTRYSKNVFQL